MSINFTSRDVELVEMKMSAGKIWKTVFRFKMYEAKYYKGELEHGKLLVPKSRTDTCIAKKKLLQKYEIQLQKEALILLLDLKHTQET